MKSGFVKTITLSLLTLLFVSIGHSQICTESGSIKRVKNRSIGNVEYVIFDIYKQNDSTTSKMDYEVETARSPFTDYSGDETIPVNGDKFKKITFRSIYWMCETQKNITTPKTAIKDIKNLSSFEGIVEYVVGFRARSRYITTYQYDAGSVIKVVMKFRK